MFRSDLIPALPAAIAAIASGDNSILDPLAAEFAPAANPHDNFAAGMNEVVICADEGAALTAADRAARTTPGVWEDLLLEFFPDCDAWDVTPVDGGHLQHPTGDVPVLVLSGALDPTIPTTFIDEVRTQFPNTTVITVPAGGHALYRYNDCLQSITLAFTANPTHHSTPPAPPHCRHRSHQSPPGLSPLILPGPDQPLPPPFELDHRPSPDTPQLIGRRASRFTADRGAHIRGALAGDMHSLSLASSILASATVSTASVARFAPAWRTTRAVLPRRQLLDRHRRKRPIRPTPCQRPRQKSAADQVGRVGIEPTTQGL